MSAENGLVGDGDQDNPLSLPSYEPDPQIANDEKNIAKYSRSAEFQRFKKLMESRIAYFQKHLPNGTEVKNVSMAELAQQWVVANTIIEEFTNIISFYDKTTEQVKKHEQERQTGS